MSVKSSLFNADYIIKEYLSGIGIMKLCKKYKASFYTVNDILLKRGIKRERPINTVDHETVITLHNQGIGVSGIAKRLGVSPGTIKLVLLRNNIKPRNRHEQQLVRMQNTTPEDRKKLTQKAHEAKRGKPNSLEAKEKHALTIFKKGTYNTSKYETFLYNLLVARGLSPLRQFPVSIYNCDLALPPVMVEIFGGHWHWSGSHLAIIEERVRCILNAGYHLLIFPVNNISPFTESIADYIISFFDFAQRNPAATREYRVIWRSGEVITSGCIDDDNISIEYPFTIRRNISNGQYESIPKHAIHM